MVDVAHHVAALRRDGQSLALAADRAGIEAPLPTCPDWVVRDLLLHLGGVYRWAAGFVAEGWTQPRGIAAVMGRHPSDADLPGWFRRGHADLVETLEAADPAVSCWTFLSAPSPLAFWARRQAHETAIHRADVELAAGGGTSFPPEFAADGIDELLRGFVPRPKTGLVADPAATLRVVADDVDTGWLVRMAPDHTETTDAPGTADCTVTGPASDLYLTLWQRRPPDGLHVDGDEAVLAHFLAGARI